MDSIVRVSNMSIQDKTIKPPAICVLGPPCSGLGSIISEISQKYGLIVVNIEKLLKEETTKDSPLSIKAQEALEKGE